MLELIVNWYADVFWRAEVWIAIGTIVIAIARYLGSRDDFSLARRPTLKAALLFIVEMVGLQLSGWAASSMASMGRSALIGRA
jgi:hypothetical protein